MATIAESEASMTVFYSKSTGALKGIYSGIQDMRAFGIDAEDYSQIWDFKIVPNDDYVLANPNLFIMDISSAEPILCIKKDSVNQYPVI